MKVTWCWLGLKLRHSEYSLLLWTLRFSRSELPPELSFDIGPRLRHMKKMFWADSGVFTFMFSVMNQFPLSTDEPDCHAVLDSPSFINMFVHHLAQWSPEIRQVAKQRR